MGKKTLILGGARSGKSSFALKLAGKAKGRVAFIATCEPKDAEMVKRVILHKKTRPNNWKTFDAPLNPEEVIKKNGVQFDTIILDCLTLLICNYMMKDFKPPVIEKKIKNLINAIVKSKANIFVVSNEVGLGIVPENKMARDFRDIAGRVNQLFAKKSDQVFFMVSGIPWRIK